MNLYLIRHGKTTQASSGIAQDKNASLDPNYFYLLEETIHKIHKINKIDFGEIISSPLKRAKETTKFIFPKQKIVELEYIYEYIRPKFLDGVDRNRLVTFWEIENKKAKYDPNWKLDGSESFNEILKRVKKLVDYLESKKDSKNIAIIGHGTFFTHLYGYLTYKDNYNTKIFFDELKDKIQIDNGEILKLKI
jgi:broad specificity phosphatase PhoE